MFEQLTHCAKWKVLSARTVGYDHDLPCIQLVDSAPDKVSLASELVMTPSLPSPSSPKLNQDEVSLYSQLVDITDQVKMLQVSL